MQVGYTLENNVVIVKFSFIDRILVLESLFWFMLLGQMVFFLLSEKFK